MKLSKLLSLGTAFSLLATSLSIPAMAVEPNPNEPSFSVYSPSFPDAYIITEVTPSAQYFDGASGNLGSVTATVFVEETYGMVDGELAVTESRLLTEEEVMAIGVDNFCDLSSVPTPKAATNSRGKLTITFSGSYRYVGNGVSCDLEGTADWDISGLNVPGANFPATGDDFIGVTWAGSYTSSDYSISGKQHNGGTLDIYEYDSVPNTGRVWSFADLEPHPKYDFYATDIDLNMTITKNTLEGNGNTAEAVLKYIHTYSKVNGSISITPGNKTSPGSFSLSNTDKQWSIVCTVTDIPY